MGVIPRGTPIAEQRPEISGAGDRLERKPFPRRFLLAMLGRKQSETQILIAAVR